MRVATELGRGGRLTKRPLHIHGMGLEKHALDRRIDGYRWQGEGGGGETVGGEVAL